MRSLGYRRAAFLLRLGVIAAFILAWEITAHFIVTAKGTSGDPNFPSIEFLGMNSLLRMSDYWSGGMGAPSPQNGGKETYLGAFLALGSASVATLERIGMGVLLGVVAGTGVGLLTAAFAISRYILRPPVHFMRMVPFLALAPLFAVWFGKETRGVVLFIAYGVTVVMFTGTINSVELIPKVFLQRAATNGASTLRVYREIILPFIIPPMRATLLVAIGLAWTLDVAAELLGSQTGLGVIMQDALRFAYTGRVLLVGFVIVLYAALTYYLIEALTARAIRWHAATAHR